MSNLSCHSNFHMSQKQLSIIVPSYNMEQYLSKCLGSLVVAPELMGWLEVLVVNDGSKDRTSEIAHEFAAKWPGTFKVIDKENGHYGSCINAALKVASGKYVKVLDADDWFDSEGFAAFLTYLSDEVEGRYGGVDLVLTDYDCVDDRGGDTGKIRQRLPVGCVFGIDKLVARKEITFMHGYTYRTNLLRELQYRQTEGIMYTDTEWIFYPAACAKRICYFPRVVYIYLFGRAGQTVSPEVERKNTVTFVTLLDSMLKLYMRVSGGLSADGKTYMRRHLARILRQIYLGYFVCTPFRVACRDLAGFDRRLHETSSEVYDLASEQVQGKLGKFIYAWRCSKMLRPIFVLGVRLFYSLRSNG